MSCFPEDVKYSMQHLWLRLSDGRDVRVGATDHWLESLGTIMHIDLPTVGSVVQAGDKIGELVGPAASEVLIAPISGIVTATNSRVCDEPDLARSEPYGSGWLFEVEIAAETETAELPLLDAQGYAELVGE